MRNIESYNIPEPILEACKSLGVKTLAEFLQRDENEFMQILRRIDMLNLYELVDEYGLKWGSAENRVQIRNYCMNKDQVFCLSMIFDMLSEDIEKWKEAEREYAEHPENFEDLTKYDEHGHPYYDDEDFKYEIPNRTYENFLYGLTFEYEPLTHLGCKEILILLNARKFVKHIPED